MNIAMEPVVFHNPTNVPVFGNVSTVTIYTSDFVSPMNLFTPEMLEMIWWSKLRRAWVRAVVLVEYLYKLK